MKKSKFIVFLLSFFPGLGHIYLGCFSRGYIFMGAVAAGIILILGLCFLSRSESPLILLLGYPLLWFVALVDSLALTEMVNQVCLLLLRKLHRHPAQIMRKWLCKTEK